LDWGSARGQERGGLVATDWSTTFVKQSELAKMKFDFEQEAVVTEAAFIADPTDESAEKLYRESLSRKFTNQDLIESTVIDARQKGTALQIDQATQQIIIDGARELIEKAAKNGDITSEQARSLNSSLNSFASGTQKAAAKLKSEKDKEAYKSVSDEMLAGTLDQNAIKDSGLIGADQDFIAELMPKTWKPLPTETTLGGQDDIYDIVFQRSAEEIGDVEATQAAMTELFDKRSITEDDYKWAMDKIENPYPRQLVPAISERYKSHGKNWWGTSQSEKDLMQLNKDFTAEIDRLVADEAFQKMSLDKQSEKIINISASSIANVQPTDINDLSEAQTNSTRNSITVVAPDGTIAEIYADELEQALSEGARVY
jgi:hypothetical protein